MKWGEKTLLKAGSNLNSNVKCVKLTELCGRAGPGPWDCKVQNRAEFDLGV